MLETQIRSLIQQHGAAFLHSLIDQEDQILQAEKPAGMVAMPLSVAFHRGMTAADIEAAFAQLESIDPAQPLPPGVRFLKAVN